jgi:hypothetical protein
MIMGWGLVLESAEGASNTSPQPMIPLAPLSGSPYVVGQWDAESHYARADAPAIAVVPPVAVRPRPALAAAADAGRRTVPPKA